jgi:uncharacterized protein (TIGR02145 family)
MPRLLPLPLLALVACGGAAPIAQAPILVPSVYGTRPATPSPPPLPAPLGPDQIRDPRDGHVYGTVVLGSTRWLAENMAYALPGSLCYGDDEHNCARYGRLYSWDAAMLACPPGWHLPSEQEWELPERQAGGLEPLLEGGASGFRIRKGGKHGRDGDEDLGAHFYFWSATEFDEDTTRARLRWNLMNDAMQIATDAKTEAYSVRCLTTVP